MAKITSTTTEVLVETDMGFGYENRTTSIVHGTKEYSSEIKHGFGAGLWTWREACECIRELSTDRCADDILKDPKYLLVIPEDPTDFECMAKLSLNDEPIRFKKLLKISAAATDSVIFQNMSSKERQMTLRRQGIVIPIQAENSNWCNDRVSIIKWKLDNSDSTWHYMFEYRV